MNQVDDSVRVWMHAGSVMNKCRLQRLGFSVEAEVERDKAKCRLQGVRGETAVDNSRERIRTRIL